MDIVDSVDSVETRGSKSYYGVQPTLLINNELVIKHDDIKKYYREPITCSDKTIEKEINTLIKEYKGYYSYSYFVEALMLTFAFL